MTKIKRLVFAGLCVALGVILPLAFHSIPNAGKVFLPMHIPVLLSGFICGPIYGLACGILTPLISSLLTSMPPMAILPSMMCELAIYGLLSSLIIKLVNTKSRMLNIYISLIGAMLCGRVVYGILNAFIFNVGEYSLNIWVTTAFVTSFPGIVTQLIVIPIILFALDKTKIFD